jgi:D-lactate dehydrogenase (cytochrome)
MNAPDTARRPLPAAALDGLRALLGARVSTGESVRTQHGRDESAFPPMPPDAVAFPQSTDEVAAIARLCHA